MPPERARFDVWHFWAGDKPWWLHFTRCPSYFEFLDAPSRAAASKCRLWLRRRWERAKTLPSNWTCGGVQQCVF